MKKLISLACFLISITAFSQNELPNIDLTTTDGKKINFQNSKWPAGSEHKMESGAWAFSSLVVG